MPVQYFRQSHGQAVQIILHGVLEHHRCLELLEGTGVEEPSPFRPVPVEGYVKVLKAEALRKPSDLYTTGPD